MKKQMKTGIKTFGDEEIDSPAYSHDQDYSTWGYMNPRIEQRGPVHSAMMQSDDQGQGDQGYIHSASWQPDRSYETTRSAYPAPGESKAESKRPVYSSHQGQETSPYSEPKRKPSEKKPKYAGRAAVRGEEPEYPSATPAWSVPTKPLPKQSKRSKKEFKEWTLEPMTSIPDVG